MSRMLTICAALMLWACGQGTDQMIEPSAGRAEDRLSNYQTVELECTWQQGVTGSITDTRTLIEPFYTRVEVQDQDHIVVKGDLVRFFIPEGEGSEEEDAPVAAGPYVQICEAGINIDPLMFLFARRPGEPWRVVKAPISLDYGFSCSAAEVAAQGPACEGKGCCTRREDGEYRRTVTLEADLDAFHWFQVIASYDPDQPAPADPCFDKPRQVLAHREKDKHTGKPGLLMAAVPSNLESIEEIKGHSMSIYSDLIFHAAVFVPFEDIPALQDIAGGPVELAVMGMNRMSLFGDLSTFFGYDLYVDCPGCVSQVTDPKDTSDNCMLPDTL